VSANQSIRLSELSRTPLAMACRADDESRLRRRVPQLPPPGPMRSVEALPLREKAGPKTSFLPIARTTAGTLLRVRGRRINQQLPVGDLLNVCRPGALPIILVPSLTPLVKPPENIPMQFVPADPLEVLSQGRIGQ
jgi:hypothetical protein